MYNKNDPLVNSVKNIMEQNELRRRVEEKLCEELGIYSRKVLPREHHANYDALLEERLAEAGKVLPDLTQKEPEKKHSKGYFDAENRKKVSKQRYRDEMKAVGKYVYQSWGKKADEKKKTVKEALHPNQQKLDVHEPEKDELTKHDFKMLRAKKTMKEEEQLDEVSKKTLKSYIKKASHDVATKSAATGRYAERANKEEDTRKKTGDYSGYRQGRKDNETAEKMFKKSWKRREGIAKATDKLEEGSLDEASYSAKAARAGKDIGKPGKNFAKIAKEAEKRYGSKKSGENVAGAILAKIRAKKMEEEVQDSKNPLPPAGANERIQNKLGTGPKSSTETSSDSTTRTQPSAEDKAGLKSKIDMNEAAKSKAQQRIMGMALAMRRGESDRGSSKVAKIATDMPEKELEKFAKTKRKGLPEKVKKMDENLTLDEVMEEIARNLGEEVFTSLMEYAQGGRIRSALNTSMPVDSSATVRSASERDDAEVSQQAASNRPTVRPLTPSEKDDNEKASSSAVGQPSNVQSPAQQGARNVRQALDVSVGKTQATGPQAGVVPSPVSKEKSMPADKAPEGSSFSPSEVAKQKQQAPVKPGTEPPKAEPPKAEPPKAEPPKAEPPKAEPTFKQAFAAARKEADGAGGKFTWQGKEYQTNVSGEKYRPAGSLKTTGGSPTPPMPPRRPAGLRESLENTIRKIIKE